ncbi:MAG: hypothetical protein R3E12_11595 [Candidatus Eisenbacteria bacterium]
MGESYVLNQGRGDFPPDLYGFILWGNSAPQGPAIHLEGSTSSAVHVRYCDVEGGWAGTGVINQVPQFADASYHLAPQSPCVDAGNPAVPFNDVCFPPSQGGVRNDMGAYGGPGACDWDEQTADVPDDDGPGHDGSGPDDDGPGPGHDGSGPDDDAPGSSYGGLAVAWSVPVVVTAAVLPVTVQWDSAHAGMPARLDVLDIAGRSVGVSWQGRAGEPSEITLEVQRLPRGVYFARLAIGSRQSARRFVLMN